LKLFSDSYVQINKGAKNMSKTFRFIITAFLSISILAACNSTEEQSSTEPANEPSDSATIDTTTTPNEANKPAEVEEPATEDSQKEQPAQEETSDTSSTSITFSSNGESKNEEATPVSSKQYGIQVISGFTLVQEEPGKELLTYDADDSVSMRIEAMTINDTTFEDLVANTEQYMSAVSEDSEPYDISTIIDNNSIANSTAYIANFGTEEVISVVFEKEDKLVRLTVYDNEEVDLSDAMIKMGLTIE